MLLIVLVTSVLIIEFNDQIIALELFARKDTYYPQMVNHAFRNEIQMNLLKNIIQI